MSLIGGPIMSTMSRGLKAVLATASAIGIAFVGWRFILPLAALYLAGVGVEAPFPLWFAKSHPRLAIYLFVFGGPALFVALIATLLWLRFRPHHHLEH